MSSELQEIVVPVDGSASSQRAAAFASRLAQATGARLKLLYVFQAGPGHVVSMARLSKEEIDRIRKQVAQEVFEKVRQALGETAQEIEEVVLIGDAAEETLVYLNSHPGSLAVMGRRGLSPMQSLLLGSVSEKVVRHASGPVTIVH